MKLRASGKLGELCNDAGVPITDEKVIGFRQLRYQVFRKGLRKSSVLPKTSGWVYLTAKRILMLDDGWSDQDGAKWKSYQEVPFAEAQAVRYKGTTVWVDVTSGGEDYMIAYTPYGAAARLFTWLKAEKEARERREAGEVESAYVKEKFYRHPPK